MDHKKRRKTVHCSDYRIHSSYHIWIDGNVYIPVRWTGGADTATFCPWIYKGRICIFNMLFCVPFIRKWTPAETDPKVGSQGVENDSVCGWNVKAVQVWTFRRRSNEAKTGRLLRKIQV